MGNQNKEITEDKKMPEKKFRAGGITATIWKNEGKDNDGNKTEFNTVGLERSYKDKNDEWQKTNTMRLNDLPKVVLVCSKSYEYLVLKKEEE